MRRLGPLYPGAVALRQTTALRWPIGLITAGDDIARSAPWMVAIGAALGLCGYSVGWVLGGLGAAPALAGVVALAVATALGGGVVELGLARHADQARVGAGPLAIALLALLRATALLSTSTGLWLGALVLAPAAGRWGALLVQRLDDTRPLDPTPVGRDLLVGAAPWPVVAAAGAVLGVAATFAFGWTGVVAVAAAGGAAVGVAYDARRRERTVGADAVATAAAAAELVTLVAAAIAHAATLSPFLRG